MRRGGHALRRAIFVLLSLLAFTVPGFAQEAPNASRQSGSIRYRVAVREFVVIPLVDSIPEELKTELGRAMAVAFNTPLVASGRFDVVEREQLDTVLEEIQLSEEGITEREENLRFGELANAQLVISGTITIYSNEQIDVQARFFDIRTASVPAAPMIQGTGPQDFRRIAEQLVAEASRVFPLRGRVIDVREEGVFINLGSASGLTDRDATGIVQREIVLANGEPFPRVIGSFEVQNITRDFTQIAVTLDDPADEVGVGDIVQVQALDEPVRPPPPEMATVTLRGAPSEARVFVDDEFFDTVGSGPLELSLEAGSHSVRIEADGYHPFETDLALEPNEARPLPVELDPILARIAIDFDPEDARITIDGAPSGSDVELLPGTYRVAVSAEGYREYREEITLTPGQVFQRSVILEPLLARVRLTLEPPTAEATLDGVPVAGTELEIAPGEHVLRVEAEGFDPQELTLVLAPGQQRDVPVALEPLPPPATEAAEPVKGPAAEVAPAEPATSEEAAPAAGAGTVGLVSVTSSLPGTRIALIDPFSGEVAFETTLEETAGEYEVDAGIYDVLASAPATRQRRDVTSVTAGGRTNLELRLEPVDLVVEGGRVSHEEREGLFLSARVEGQLVTDAITLKGAEGWNEGDPLVLAASEAPFRLVWEPTIPTGQYTIEMEHPSYGPLFHPVAIGDSNAAAVADLTILRTDAGPTLQWSDGEAERNYWITVRDDDRLIAQVVVERPEARMEALQPGHPYEICVMALPETSAVSTAAAMTCETLTLRQIREVHQTDDDDGGNGGGPNCPPLVPCDP